MIQKIGGEEPVNLGAGREITIRELTQTVGRLVGYEGRVRFGRTFLFHPSSTLTSTA